MLFSKKKKYKRIFDNKMRWEGDIDDEKKIIRINKKKSKKKSSIISTIIHEELHRKHPQMTEKNIRKLEKEKVETMDSKQKRHLSLLYE